ncbi:MAG: RNA-splicing ligase RtcB [Elusimicrobia bacterium GWA2_69_24]|nr:MAG: RNA-splicing ligase RtcB [Elusimicrobia bacterium GWA2_69_24]
MKPRTTPAPYRSWGRDFDSEAVRQMENACRLPVSIQGALMPDAHVGYGLPIGGVLAVRDAVIPYAVGVDIACRMKLSVLDLPAAALRTDTERLSQALLQETRFGVGAAFERNRQHAVMDEDWSFSPVTRRFKDKAWSQLGTSGSGNHFVEFGRLTVLDPAAGLAPGEYTALLSHSGSRGTGLEVARHYSELARDRNPGLPKELAHLAWLGLETEAGQEYWRAMELMGRYAAANHALIHSHVTAALGAKIRLDIENHHNFAWKELRDGREVIVHRKGATPAGRGIIGIIPGTMATPGYVVRGKGHPDSLDSAAHGAGRRMSRKRAKDTFTQGELNRFLAEKGVKLLSAGLDEAPMAYKDIDQVMAAQADLVEILARFDPRLVRMAPGRERPEG